MAPIRHLWESDPIQYILNWKFPQLMQFNFKTLQPYVAMGMQKTDSLAKEAKEYRQELLTRSPSELTALLEEAKAAEWARYAERLRVEEQQRSFNQPNAALHDFNYWAKISFWTLDEAVAMALERDPRQVSWKHVQSVATVSAFAAQYASQRELVTRAVTMGQLWESTAPSVFLAWANRTNFVFPDKLAQAVTKLGIQIADWKTLYEKANDATKSAQALAAEKHSALMAAMADHSQSLTKLSERYQSLLDQRDELSRLKDGRIESLADKLRELEKAPTVREKSLGTRERESLLKLVIGMAMGFYGYDPKSARALQTKQIADDLERAGIALDVDTVRKYLSEAKDLLPPD
ncbi:hypothetical protein [Mesorhizobium sp.]|uniref:hypothetical protein n=1 Tax=Mesorhizobium sp. TaxID=1871066 RepID=UPI001211E711|nr:hypothetical protein [Mesorhizobium sp.]TIL63838.1 MAG: hypothetical protein E5Y77_29955 [Mesorhizobium sp.]